jgi:hypothetical protein
VQANDTPNGTGDRTTAREREELVKLSRRHERFATTMAKQRTAQLMADVEEQLAAVYKDDDERWREVTVEAKAVVDAANEHILARCREFGIPEELAPALSLGWAGRGENFSKERRAELRRVAQTRLAAVEQAAITEIQRACLAFETAVLAGGLVSDAARSLLDRLPSAEALMPPLDVESLQEQIPALPDLLKRYASKSAYLRLGE